MTASISGSLLSSLLFKLKNGSGDADGFFLGEVHKHSVENITDSQSSGTKEEKKLCIQSYVCFRKKYKFYDCFGIPDLEKIERELGTRFETVIGWFSYRRNSSHRMSMRERVIHQRLMNMFGNIHKQDFLFALVTDQLVDNSTIHSTEYSFYNWIGSSPQTVSVEVINLRASASVPYQTMPSSQLPPTLIHYSSVLQEQRSQFMNSESHMIQAQTVENLYKAVLERLKPLKEELMKSTDEVTTLGREVASLQQQVDNLRASAEEAKKDEEKKQNGNDATSAPEEPPMLISLDSPTDDHKQNVSALEQNRIFDTSNQQTSDLLGVGLVLSNPMLRDSNTTESDILQPEVLVSSKPAADSEHQNNNMILQQSQELF